MINLTATDSSIQFEFINSPSYPQDGVVECPKNSLTLITDESDYASFLKAQSHDVFISATYDELGKSKSELIEWFKDNAVGETGGGGGLTPEEAQEMIDESISGKADSSAVTEEISAAVSGKADTSAMTTALADKADVSSLTAYFDGAEYNSNNKTIEFYNGNVLKDSIDATAFIKDGMVDTVSIEDITSGGTTVNCLVITFNTDSGKENINIPIKDIFDSDLYYTKTATDGLLDAKLNISDFNAYSGGVNTAITSIEGDITDVQTALNGKANASDLQALEVVVGTKANATDLDSLANVVNGKVDVSAYTAYTSSTETTINGKASQTDLNTLSGAVDTLSGQVADKADTTAMTTALADKLDISTFTAYSANVDTALQGKTDLSAYTAYTSATDTALSGKASQTDLNTVSGDVATVSGSVANKQDLLVSGTNIKTVNGNSLLGSGNITIEGGQTVTSVTQADFEALVVKNPDTFYIISDATGSSITIDSSLDSGSTNPVANSAVTTAIDTVSAATASNTTSINTINTQLGGYTLWKGTTSEYNSIVTKSPTTIYFIVD